MGNSFNEKFDQHGLWRREFALRLKLLSEWMRGHHLMDDAVEERLQRLEGQIRTDKVMVAFVAEFSRGKSELINAIFFAGYGRRIMPASAGRTTMCPTELGYDPQTPQCLRLLPIKTRLAQRSLAQWREFASEWTQIDLNVQDSAQMAQAFEKVAEVSRVSKDEARALGFWHDETPDDNPSVDASGMVEVPKWRHALINIAHPLLKQGLVILDTPGLNAIGAEPELTMSLIPQAHAVVFILAADAGVTRSDLSIWKEHLATDGWTQDARIVVLNKIDTLWDELSTKESIAVQIERQRKNSAEVLEIPIEQVIAVSAQKGLLAKIEGNQALLTASALETLETALSKGIMEQRQAILRSTVASGITGLRAETARVIHIRRRDLDEQLLELTGLRGKNVTVVRSMRTRIEQEQREFDTSMGKVHAVRTVHLKLLQEVIEILDPSALKSEMANLVRILRQSGIKLGVRKAYADTFVRLRTCVERAQKVSLEIQGMLEGTFKQLNAEYSFSLQAPLVPNLEVYLTDLSRIEESHLQYMGVSNILKLSQEDFVRRLVRALDTRLRTVFESAVTDLELWSKSGSSQLTAQLRERRRSFTKRIDAIDRIQNAANGLDERIAEIKATDASLKDLEAKLQELTAYFLTQAPSKKVA